MFVIKSVASTAFKLTHTVTLKALAIVSPLTPEFIKTKAEKVVKLGEKIYEKPYEATKE
jgi:hypothetical protein